MSKIIVRLLFLLILFQPCIVFGLEPDELLVLANRRVKGSVALAEYYMEKRNIPKENLLVLATSGREVISREEYEKNILTKVQKKLAEYEKAEIAGIVTVYGIPLKVLPPRVVGKEKKELLKLRKSLQILRRDKAEKKEIQQIEARIKKLSGTNKRAAVDSELAMAKVKAYRLDSWIANPYFAGFYSSPAGFTKDDVLLVSRIDGPDLDVAYRIINDSLAAEKNGLAGKAYFDARWTLPEKKQLSGYALYDASIHQAALAMKEKFSVILDNKEKLFAENSAPDAMLYCGWYSYGKYIDSFTWLRGAVGYHIASAECSTLKKKDSTVWCLKMLEKGVAATVGPVYEPYVQGFPLPEIFFKTFASGDYNLGESYLLSLPFVSWQVILVGDPLYQPFH